MNSNTCAGGEEREGTHEERHKRTPDRKKPEATSGQNTERTTPRHKAHTQQAHKHKHTHTQRQRHRHRHTQALTAVHFVAGTFPKQVQEAPALTWQTGLISEQPKMSARKKHMATATHEAQQVCLAPNSPILTGRECGRCQRRSQGPPHNNVEPQASDAHISPTQCSG